MQTRGTDCKEFGEKLSWWIAEKTTLSLLPSSSYQAWLATPFARNAPCGFISGWLKPADPAVGYPLPLSRQIKE
eukprot:1143614-Pelagomonas_calceolata.AAC.1